MVNSNAEPKNSSNAEPKPVLSKAMFGRKIIYTDATEITAANIAEVLGNAIITHETNRLQIDYLYQYYKGKQPILGRTKIVRDDINHKIVENRANEIVSFKVGYLMGEPVQYVSRTDDTKSEDVNRLNEYVFAEDKPSKDKELADWFTICGTAYRMVVPDKRGNIDGVPFHIYTLDPRNAFVVYQNALGNKPMLGVYYITDIMSGEKKYFCYTENRYFVVLNGKVEVEEAHMMGGIPIIEYPANNARLGAFEIVLPLLDAINEAASDRLDSIAAYVESLLVLKGVDIDAEDFKALKELGGIKVPPDGDVKYIGNELNQDSTQTLVKNLYDAVLTICGMPNRNGGSSTSDTGVAVVYRDGYAAAETRAKDSELMFKRSEKEFLRIALLAMNVFDRTDLTLADIEIRFTRRNYENISGKATVLTTMLGCDKIHPKLAFEYCGMFIDPEIAYTMSKEYYEERRQEFIESAMEERTEEVNTDAETV